MRMLVTKECETMRHAMAALTVLMCSAGVVFAQETAKTTFEH